MPAYGKQLNPAEMTALVGSVYNGLPPSQRAGTAILTCVLFGLAPALRATRVAPAAVIRSAGRGLTAGREKFSLRRLLVVAQVAMSLVLLVGALLLLEHFRPK